MWAREKSARNKAELELAQKTTALQLLEQENQRLIKNQRSRQAPKGAAPGLDIARNDGRQNSGDGPATANAQKRLWDAVEIIRDGFALFDQNDRLVASNQTYTKFLRLFSDASVADLTYRQLLGMLARSDLIDFGHETAAEWMQNMLAWHARADDSEITIRLSGDRWLLASERRTEAGDTASLVVDITHAKRRERELETARRDAEDANHAKSSFLANMSHEIRTPMNGVVGMADLLVDTELDPEQALFAKTIKSSGEMLLVILNDVLDYSKIEAGKLDLCTRPFDLEQCVLDVVLLLQPRAREKNIDLLVDYDMFLPADYFGDAGRVRQILTNLVGNAVKFTDTGFVLVRVVGIETAKGHQEIHIAVEDSGIGIADDKIATIFSEFDQVEDQTVKRFEGTGLGLAISKRLIEMMGGEIWVDSTLGSGSCFGFRLGLKIGSAKSRQELDMPGIKRALIVDDLKINRFILSRQLSFFGVDVTCAQNADEALAQLQDMSHPPFDVLITDHNMPGTNGLQLVSKMRKIGSDLPAILLSSGSIGPKSAIPDNLFSEQLRKPILRDDLRASLLRLANPQERAQNLAPAQKTTTVSPLVRFRILAAEDNQTNRLVLSKMLAGMNIDLDFATDGYEAVDKFKIGLYRMIFMDISMPGMDGMAATRQIRQIEQANAAPYIPIVALTAHAMDGDTERFRRSGMDFHLTKPLTRASIARQIDEILHLPDPTKPTQS